jgi:hypothetical protein
VPLVLDLRIAHDRVGSNTDPTLNGHLRYPNDLDQSLNDTVADKIRKYRVDYNHNPPSTVSFMTVMVSTSGRSVNLSDFYSYKLIGKLTVFLATSGVHLVQTDRGMFHYRRVTFSSMIKSSVGYILAKVAALRITLNLDGAPIISKSHTHPSHSQTSRLLTSSPTQCMRGA